MIKVAVNGYGTIGRRVAEAIEKQPDMKLIGVAKIKPDYNAVLATRKGIKLYVPADQLSLFEKKGIKIAGTIEEMVEKADIVIDATPGGKGREYKNLYLKYGVKHIFQGGEKPDVAEISFNTACNYNEALGKNSARVVSCNTTGLLRSLCRIKSLYSIKEVFATIIRRAADPKEIRKGPINAIKPDPVAMPSHHAKDVKTILPSLNIVTAAVVVPTTLMHVHIVRVHVNEKPAIEDVLQALNAPRIILVNSDYGFKSTADIVEFFREYGRKRYDIPELVIWEDSITVDEDKISWIQAVHQESIVVPENIDAIRALMNTASLEETQKITDTTLGLLKGKII